jgi:PAS domain S-box-containing protein
MAELLDLSPDALLIVNQAGTIMMANEQVSALFGYSSEELLGKPPELLLPESLRVLHCAHRQQYFTTPRTRSMGTGLHLFGQRKDGTQFPVDISLRPVLLKDDLLVIAAIRDMSEQAAVRAEAEAAHARLYELFMQAPVALAILRGPEHRYEFANSLSFSYRHRADPTGKTVREALPELVEQGHLAMLDTVYATGTPFVGTELPIRLDRRGDGVLEEGFYNQVYQPTRSLQGDIDGIWVYSFDVTEHVRARRQLEELNRQLEVEKQALRQAQQEAERQAAELSAIFEAMTDGVFVCDGRGDIYYTNAAYRALLELEGDADPSVLKLDKRFKWLALHDLQGKPLPKEQFPILRVLRGERLSGAHTMDLLGHTYKGADRILNVSGAPIRDAAGQITGGVIVYRDVTERHSLEQQLQYSERKLRSLVESNVVGVSVFDVDGRIFEVNDRYAQILGYSRDELLAESFNWSRYIPPDAYKAVGQVREIALTTGVVSPLEREYLRKDGTRVPILVAGTLFDHERRLVLGVLLDMSEQKAAERRKQEFLRIVSHELRTPLTAILGLIELALLQIKRPPTSLTPEAEELLGKIEQELRLACGQVDIETRLVEDLLEVSRLEMHQFSLSLQRVNLVPIVQETVASHQAARTRDIELVVPSEELVPVLVDAGRIEQVLTNYLTNALNYAPVDRVICVRLEVTGTVARVSVCDQGPGLTPEQRQRVWEQFYQVASPDQRRPERGLGLGLAIAKAIVEQHQGQVGVESAPGRGATFWFTLPLSTGPIQSIASPGI